MSKPHSESPPESTIAPAPSLRRVRIEHFDEKNFQQLQAEYQSNAPFPYLVIDNFLTTEAAEALEREVSLHSEGWINYHHFNEKKRGFNQLEAMSPSTRAVLGELQSADFLNLIEQLTGIDGLVADPDMDGGGFHEMKRDGFLNVHVDFLAHTIQKHWSRQINLLLYLNRDWKDEYNGHLELWDANVSRCAARVRPDFNRCVIFHTAKKSFHGVPEKILCPPDRSRKSLALYYFKDEQKNCAITSTNYRPRPQDTPAQRALIAADRGILRMYSYWKRYFGVSESKLTKILKVFFR